MAMVLSPVEGAGVVDADILARFCVCKRGPSACEIEGVAEAKAKPQDKKIPLALEYLQTSPETCGSRCR